MSASDSAQLRPLDGVLVVGLEQAVAAPLCTAQLARAGARVIKIERHEGDFARGYDSVVHGESAYFVWLNAGKESIRIDLRDPADLALLKNMIARADVFIQNLAPGSARRQGLGTTELRADNPRLITVDISGYGEEGAYQGMKAYDLLIQAEAGIAWTTGTESAPGRVGVSICDIACGMYAYSAVLEAIVLRDRSGVGSELKVSLFDAAANWMTVPLLHQEYGGAPPARIGLRHPSIAPYGLFTCSDGGEILIAVQNEREWLSLCCNVLGVPELAVAPEYASNELRVKNRMMLEHAISTRIGEFGHAELAKRLQNGNVAFGRVNDIAGLSRHPQLRRETIDSPTGQVNLVSYPAIRVGETISRVASPALGEHDAALRREFA